MSQDRNKDNQEIQYPYVEPNPDFKMWQPCVFKNGVCIYCGKKDRKIVQKGYSYDSK